MPNPVLSTLTIPVLSDGQVTNVTYDIKDAKAREDIANLGSAVYWIGVTTTQLTDGATTNPITVNGQSITVKTGGMAQYDGEEYVWSSSAWQLLGQANFGALAFKSSASSSYTPAGTVSVSQGTDSTTTVNSITAVGTLPTFTVSSENLTYTAGTLPTKSSDQTVVTASGTRTASFSGTSTTITVS